MRCAYVYWIILKTEFIRRKNLKKIINFEAERSFSQRKMEQVVMVLLVSIDNVDIDIKFLSN